MMFNGLYLTVLFYAVCWAMPTFDSHSMKNNNEMENIRVKRYGLLGDYTSYLNNAPYSYKFKTPFFKMKIRGGPNNIVPPYGMGVPGAVYNPTYAYGHGAFHAPFHAPVNFPYGYNYNPYHGYGWHG